MCKIAVFTNVNEMHPKQVEKLIDKVAFPITATETDGFGFAYNTDKGIYSERWLDPDDFLTRNIGFGPSSEKFVENPEMLAVGKAIKPRGGLLIHGRTSTNAVSLPTTHPFLDNRYALIHNGIVYSESGKDKRKTLNDTEFILNRYSEGGIKRVADTLSGYYAVGMLDNKTGGTIIFRDDTASLYVAWFAKYKTYCFATTTEIIYTAAAALKIDKVSARPAKENFHAVFDREGLLTSHETFESNGRSFGAMDMRSLGYRAMGPVNQTVTSPPVTSLHPTEDIPGHKEYAPRESVYMNHDGDQLTESELNLLPPHEQDRFELLMEAIN